jgi:hypothetical protein
VRLIILFFSVVYKGFLIDFCIIIMPKVNNKGKKIPKFIKKLNQIL